MNNGVKEWQALDEQCIHLERGGEEDLLSMEMTDLEGQDNQGQRSADKKLCRDHHGPERRSSVQRSFSTPKQQLYERHGSSANVEGFEDFEEFVLDFDDYDLLESIHTQLGSPLEPIRKLCILLEIPLVVLQHRSFKVLILTI